MVVHPAATPAERWSTPCSPNAGLRLGVGGVLRPG